MAIEPAAAPRHRAAIAALALTGAEQVLEIGCGHGVAARLALALLPAGRLVALDRSPKMIAALAAAAPEAIAAGRLVLRAEPLEDADWHGERFDAIYAVNVDLNRRLGERWPPLLRSLLHPAGRLVLAFDPPPGSAAGADVARLTRDRLHRAGFRVETRTDGRVTVLIAGPSSGGAGRTEALTPRPSNRGRAHAAPGPDRGRA